MSEVGSDVTHECVANLIGNVRESASDERPRGASFMRTVVAGGFLSVASGPRNSYGRVIVNIWASDFSAVDIGFRCAFDC